MPTPNDDEPRNLYNITSQSGVPYESRISAYVIARTSTEARDLVFRETRLTHVTDTDRAYVHFVTTDVSAVLSVAYPYRAGADEIRRIADILDKTELNGDVNEPAAKLYAAGLRFTEEG